MKNFLEKNLNTSYVEVKLKKFSPNSRKIKNLNTSYVEVKQNDSISLFQKFLDLNTSYVEVKRIPSPCTGKSISLFKYILC